MKRLILASALVSTTALADPVTLLQVIVPPFIYQAYREDKEPVERAPMTVVATGVGSGFGAGGASFELGEIDDLDSGQEVELGAAV